MARYLIVTILIMSIWTISDAVSPTYDPALLDALNEWRGKLLQKGTNKLADDEELTKYALQKLATRTGRGYDANREGVLLFFFSVTTPPEDFETVDIFKGFLNQMQEKRKPFKDCVVRHLCENFNIAAYAGYENATVVYRPDPTITATIVFALGLSIRLDNYEEVEIKTDKTRSKTNAECGCTTGRICEETPSEGELKSRLCVIGTLPPTTAPSKSSSLRQTSVMVVISLTVFIVSFL